MQNAFGECSSPCCNDNVFQYTVSDDATTDNAFDSSKESKGLSREKVIGDGRLTLLQPTFDLQLNVIDPLSLASSTALADLGVDHRLE